MKSNNYICVLLVSLAPLFADAQEYRFDPKLVDAASGNVDLSTFDQGGQLPGVYLVDILINGKHIDSREILFTQEKNQQGKPQLIPCLSQELLTRYLVKVEDFTAELKKECFPLSAIPGARADLNFNNHTLNLSIPQLFLHPQLRGIAPETLWDNGIPALLLNYQASTTHTQYRRMGANSNNASWLQLSPGINLGAWRLRNITNWQQSGNQPGQWHSVNTYTERGLNSIKSRLTLGESYTSADIFNSVPFRGGMLASDESMVPGSLYQFAPVVRGVARTQARVEIKQDGNTLYNDVVAAGPFEITDLTATGSGGNLEVTIWETDGQPQEFTVPWQTPAIAIREGYLKYSLMGGQYRISEAFRKAPSVMQATAIYGLPFNLTALGGLQLAEHYLSAALGAGFSLRDWGALSFDMITSLGQKYAANTESGQALRARYSKQILQTNTSLTLSHEQTTSSGYHTLSDVLDSYTREGLGTSQHAGFRQRTGATLSQGMGDWGFFSFSGFRSSNWNRPGYSTTFNAGYTLPLRHMTVSLNWSQNQLRGNANKTDQVTSLWVSVPLHRWLGGNTNATYRYANSGTGGNTHSAGVNGALLDRRLQWSASHQYRDASSGSQNNGNVNLSWNGAYGMASGNYSYSEYSRQMGANIKGGVLAHRNGVTFSQPLSDTVALIEAPGAPGVPIDTWPGVATDFRGYTTSSYLQPYQVNTLALRPDNLPEDVEITDTDKKVVPTRGAVVPVTFAARAGGRALITVKQSDGNAVPYGSAISLNGQEGGTSIVGEGGVAYLTGLPDKGAVTVKWSDHQCQADYQLPAQKGAAGIYEMNVICHSGSDDA